MHRWMEVISISKVLFFVIAQWRNAKELQRKESAEGNDQRRLVELCGKCTQQLFCCIIFFYISHNLLIIRDIYFSRNECIRI